MRQEPREDDAGVADEVGDVEVDVVVSLEEPARRDRAAFSAAWREGNEPAAGRTSAACVCEVGERRGGDANKTRVATGSAPVPSPPRRRQFHCTRRIDLQQVRSLLFVSGRLSVGSPSRTPTARGTLPGPFDARRARDDPRRTTPRPPRPPLASRGSPPRPSRARPQLSGQISPAPRGSRSRPVRPRWWRAMTSTGGVPRGGGADSLNNYMIPNAVFLCEAVRRGTHGGAPHLRARASPDDAPPNEWLTRPIGTRRTLNAPGIRTAHPVIAPPSPP